jgi:transposase-like protein
MTFCPACDSDEAVELGVLGILKWFRCRACGMDFSRKMKRRWARGKKRAAQAKVVSA